MRLLLAAALALPLPALAQTPLGPEAFDALTRGRTFVFELGGIPYGAEEYLPNRRVRWSFLDGDCTEGRWYPSGSMICFVYEAIEPPQCWTVFDHGGLHARFEGTGGPELSEMRRTTEPLECPAEYLGARAAR